MDRENSRFHSSKLSCRQKIFGGFLFQLLSIHPLSFLHLQILDHLIRSTTPATDADSIRTLACRATAGLARCDEVRQILSRMPLIANNELQGRCLLKFPHDSLKMKTIFVCLFVCNSFWYEFMPHQSSEKLDEVLYMAEQNELFKYLFTQDENHDLLQFLHFFYF